MAKGYEETLKKVFHEILAKFAMMYGDPAGPADFQPPDGRLVEASIEFSADKKGVMRIIAPEGFCALLASNILGTEPDDAESSKDCYDSLNEFINLACGHFVTSYFGSARPSDLKPPVAKNIDAVEWSRLAGISEVRFLVDGFPVATHVEIK